jgi:hypothetical protein
MTDTPAETTDHGADYDPATCDGTDCEESGDLVEVVDEEGQFYGMCPDCREEWPVEEVEA